MTLPVEPGPAWLSYLNLAATVLLAVAVFVLWRCVRRRHGGGVDVDAVTKTITKAVLKLVEERLGEIHRITGRLDLFERVQSEMTQRLDAMAFSAREQAHTAASFHDELLAREDRRLEAQRRQNVLLEKLVSRTSYVADKLDGRPCMLNEAGNGTEACPDGQDIDQAKALEEVLPPVKTPTWRPDK